MRIARVAGLLLLGCVAWGQASAQQSPTGDVPVSGAPKKTVVKPKRVRAAKRPAAEAAGRPAAGYVPPADYSTSADFSKMESPNTDPYNGGAYPGTGRGGVHPSLGAGGGAGMNLGF